jgi:hypothetical protein
MNGAEQAMANGSKVPPNMHGPMIAQVAGSYIYAFSTGRSKQDPK